MEQLSLPLGQIVRENLSVIMSFAFSRKPLENLIDSRFEGEWKNLKKTVLDLSEERAVKACIELAMFLRFLDDEEKISEYLKENSGRTFGKLTMSNGTDKPLSLRDVMNKIIHASDYSWDFSTEDNPLLSMQLPGRGKMEMCRDKYRQTCNICWTTDSMIINVHSNKQLLLTSAQARLRSRVGRYTR